jgi:hypothetical protein
MVALAVVLAAGKGSVLAIVGGIVLIVLVRAIWVFGRRS